MQGPDQNTFGRFRLDATNECLWDGPQAISLRPKAFAVLKLLVEHSGQLVTKQKLLETVWPGTYVGDAVLKASIRQLREAMGDDAASPRYIETAHRRGYRFIGFSAGQDLGVGVRGNSAISDITADSERPASVLSSPEALGAVLGREAEFATLREWVDRGLSGDRQIVFVTGEPGIGKTSLVNGLLQQVSAVARVWIARGQCLEQFGAGEAYLPVLEGLSRLGRAPGGDRIIELLRQHAPTWLHELPSLLPSGEREALRQQAAGATRERMLREIADAIEAMTVELPLILVLEDLHWSDYSTVDLVAYLARRRDPARLIVIGTYRPVDMVLGDHPLNAVKRELQAHGLSRELPLAFLTEEAVAQYLAARLAQHQPSKRLAHLIHRRSEGNPLFMVNLVEYLLAESIIALDNGGWHLQGGLAEIESGIPENIRQLIEKQIERLSPDERRVLEGASVVGMECSSVAIGAGLDESTEWVEEHCEVLVRRYQFLTPGRLVELPDGTMTARYKFSHVLYLEVPYGLLPPTRRSQIHRRVGQRGEEIYRDRVGEIAAELAMHFEQGGDNPRAVKYLLRAATNARYRSAHHEAEALARRGMQALQRLPPTVERDQQELNLKMILGVAVMAIKGFAADEARGVFESVLELCRRHDAPSQAFRALWLLALFYYFRAELESAEKMGHRISALADTSGESFFVLEAHRGVGSVLLELGRFDEALAHLEHAATASDDNPGASEESLSGQTPQVVSACYAARAMWALGYPDAAIDRAERALSVAQDVRHPERLLTATHFVAQLNQLRGEPVATQERAETVISLAEEYGLPLWLAFGHMNRGWARIAQNDPDGGIEDMRRGLSMYDASGARLWRPHYLGLLAHALAGANHIDDAFREVASALAMVQVTGEYWCAAELHRIEGELVIMQAAGDEHPSTPPRKLPSSAASRAEGCFRQALAIARQQQARSWELRVSTSLGRLFYRQDKRVEARRVVRETLEWFKEGHDTEDQKTARTLVDAWHTTPRSRV
jgi:DNA-binding winged helix-turn-helix (wHTH) protein/tetratricopeptide (TPR) repeat protein